MTARQIAAATVSTNRIPIDIDTDDCGGSHAPMPSIYPIVNVIDAAIARLPSGWVSVEVRLSWPHYRELLAVKGMSIDRRQVDTWGSQYAKHPLKMYREHALTYIQYPSQVCASYPDQSITCVPIAHLEESEH